MSYQRDASIPAKGNTGVADDEDDIADHFIENLLDFKLQRD